MKKDKNRGRDPRRPTRGQPKRKKARMEEDNDQHEIEIVGMGDRRKKIEEKIQRETVEKKE